MTTSSEISADAVYLNWWGLLRRPPVYSQDPITRREIAGLGLCIGTGLCALWVITLLLLAPLGATVSPGPLTATSTAAILLLLPAIIGFVLPSAWWKGTALADMVGGMREKGGLAIFDRLTLAAAAIGVVGIVYRTVSGGVAGGIDGLPGSSIVLLALAVLAVGTWGTMAAIMCLPEAPFLSRGRCIPLPPWWHAPSDSTEPAIPEDQASFTFPFPEPGSPVAVVGIRLESDTLDKLRAMNREHEGRLYTLAGPESALAVVLGRDHPVLGTGSPELQRLASQFITIARREGWTSYQLASRILRFVQRSVRYVSDGDSTERILGERFLEYGRFPLEALADGEGDCDCTAILCCSLLSYTGIPSALLFVTVGATAFEPKVGHLAVGLHMDGSNRPFGVADAKVIGGELTWNGRSYLYGETACDALDPPGFGTIPETWRSRLEIDAVVEVPAYR